MSQVVIWLSDRRGCAGAVIEVVPDTHVLSPAETTNPEWVTVRVTPDLTPSEATALCVQASTIQSRLVYRVDTTGLTAATVTPMAKRDFLARVSG